MQNQGATYNPRSFRSPSSRYAGLAFTAAINAIVIWAIINGLTFRNSPPVPAPITHLQVIDQAAKSQPQPIAPPKPVMTKPAVVKDTVPVPKIDIQAQAQSQQVVAATTQIQRQNVIANSAATGIGETHTTPPYPAVARRLSQQGVVTLLLSVDARGDVTNATVKTSSGYPELDQTAASWVIAHWRYKPAVLNGTSVASTTIAAVKFDLRNAN